MERSEIRERLTGCPRHSLRSTRATCLASICQDHQGLADAYHSISIGTNGLNWRTRQRHPMTFRRSRSFGALVRKANAGRLLVPLTATNLMKRQGQYPERRKHLAWVQANLSQACVFRGRHRRLEVEIIDLLRARSGLELCPVIRAGISPTYSLRLRRKLATAASLNRRSVFLQQFAAIRRALCSTI